MIRKMLAILIACLLITTGALAAVSVPEPDEDLFYVYDGANVLSLETEAQIYYNNVNLFEACEAEIVFVVVKDTDGYSLEAYSNAIFDKWELYDRDVLVVLSIEDENYWMVQGSSIEREMTGSTMRALLEDYLEPDFAKADYDAGVRKLFDALFAEVTDIYNVDIKLVDGYAKYNSAGTSNTGNAVGSTAEYNGIVRESSSDISFGTILFIIIAILIVVSVMRSSKRTRHSSSGRKTVIITPSPRIPRTIFMAPRPGRGPHPGGFSRPMGGNSGRFSPPRTGGFGGGASSRSSGFGGRVGGTSSRSGGFGGRAGGGRSGGGGSRGGGVGRGR